MPDCFNPILVWIMFRRWMKHNKEIDIKKFQSYFSLDNVSKLYPPNGVTKTSPGFNPILVWIMFRSSKPIKGTWADYGFNPILVWIMFRSQLHNTNRYLFSWFQSYFSLDNVSKYGYR